MATILACPLGRRQPSQSLMVHLVLIRTDHLTPLDGAERDPGLGINRVFDEANRAVAEERIDATGMPAARSDERVSFVAVVVTRQLLDRLAVTETARRGGAGAPTRDTAGNVVCVVISGIGAGHPKNLEDILVAVGREPRHVGAAPASSTQIVPRRSSDAPWSNSAAKCVLLKPSVTDAILTVWGPVSAWLVPNGEAR